MNFIKKKEEPISYFNTLEFIQLYLIENIKPFCKNTIFLKYYQTLFFAIKDILENGTFNMNVDNFVTMDEGIAFNYCVFKERDMEAEMIRQEIVTFLFYNEKIYFITKKIECGKIEYEIEKFTLRQQHVKYQSFLTDKIEQSDFEEIPKSLQKII